MAVEKRSTGWLDACHHARVRELLCHVLARFEIACPAYCLMPDHGHFLWVGLRRSSDQKRAVGLFRKAWDIELAGRELRLQRQAHDHVLREQERERGAFGSVAHYIFENPVRAGLVSDWREYPFLGAVVAGYPDTNPRDEDYWERFWRIYAQLCEPA